MRTVNYRDDIIWPVVSRLGYNPLVDLLGDFANSLARFSNTWVRKCWNAADWPELILLQTRTPVNHAVPYDATRAPILPGFWVNTKTYNQNDVALDPLILTNVYISVQNANLNHLLTDAAWWTLVPAWDNTKTYLVGNKVSDPSTGLVYIAAVNILPNTIMADTLFDPAIWKLNDAQAQPPPPPPTTNNIGKVLKVYNVDPRIYDGPFDIPFTLYDTYFHVGFDHGLTVWVKYMTRANRYTLTPWTGITTFSANDVTYDPTSGNCYISLQSNNVNHVVTNVVWWALVPFPYVLAEPVSRGIYSDALRDLGQTAKANAEEQGAMAELQASIARELAPRYDILTEQQTGVPRFQSLVTKGAS